MTTVVYCKGVMACDGLISRNGVIVETYAKKFHRATDGSVLMTCGDLMKFKRFTEWYEHQSAEMPSLTSYEGTQTLIIVMRRDGVWEYDADGISSVSGDFTAWGSGFAAALGALHMGASALEAVIAASKVDCYTGGAITEMRLE